MCNYLLKRKNLHIVYGKKTNRYLDYLVFSGLHAECKQIADRDHAKYVSVMEYNISYNSIFLEFY